MSPNLNKSCLLCQLCINGNAENVYYRDERIVIMDCPICKGSAILLVFLRHGQGAIPTLWKKHADAKAREVFEDRYLYLRTFQDHGQSHEAWHVMVRGE